MVGPGISARAQAELQSTSLRLKQVVLAGLLALGAAGLVLLASPQPLRVELKSGKGKEDLSIFADSSASFYLPGDTAADSDILPRSVLADDGSATDHAESQRKVRTPNYASSHWYKQGQTTDVHGDLQDENRHREHQEMQRYAAERRHERQQEQAMARERQQRRDKAALIDRRQKLEERMREEGSSDQSMPASVKGFKDSYAYRHPFANDKKGMRHLVMAEFQQDEQKMERTTDAIFGNHKDHHRWRHGGLLLNDNSHPGTLHQAMEAQRSERLKKMKAEAKYLAESRVRKKGAKSGQQRAPTVPRVQLSCSIEMLENGGCSKGNAAVQNAAPPKYEDRASYKKRIQKKIKEARRGRRNPEAVAPTAQPNAGTVMSGWAKDLGSMF